MGDWRTAYQKLTQVAEENPWPDKMKKLFWRGNLGMGEYRRTFSNMVHNFEWSDVQEGNAENRVEIWDHCKYAYLAHIEGVSYSGRLKYLLQCGSVVVMPQPEWLEWFSPLLVDSGSKQNVVTVSRDLNHLALTMETLIKSDDWAQKVAKNAAEKFMYNHISETCEACYFREVLRRYAELQTFKPSKKDGKAFESWILYPEGIFNHNGID